MADPNLLLSPHTAGDTLEGHRALAGYMIEDVIAFLEHGEHGPGCVDPATWSIAA